MHPASLEEAFGNNFEIPNPNTHRKKCKKNKNKIKLYNSNPENYGKSIPNHKRFMSPEPMITENHLVGFQDDDQEYQNVDSDFGPTNYNIKPHNSGQYTNQFENDYSPYDDRNLVEPLEDVNSSYRPTPVPEIDYNNKTTKSSSDLDNQDIRLVEFNNKLDLILEKLNHFDEPVQENIHDIILFVIFGIFVIFIMDSVYRVGKITF